MLEKNPILISFPLLLPQLLPGKRKSIPKVLFLASVKAEGAIWGLVVHVICKNDFKGGGKGWSIFTKSTIESFPQETKAFL